MAERNVSSLKISQAHCRPEAKAAAAKTTARCQTLNLGSVPKGWVQRRKERGAERAITLERILEILWRFEHCDGWPRLTAVNRL